MHFYYDAQGRPAMVNFNGTKYHYLHNLQGDIIGIVDASGTIVVEYKYDAWGKIIGRTGSLVSTLGYLNPFRYRGYVYDEETGLYYLRSRYYNPEWGRFINADVEIGETGEMLVHNIFAYCENNPITNVDPTGESSWKALAWTGIMIAAIGLLVLATISTGGGALAFAGAGVAAAATTAANAAVGVGLATTLGSTIMFAKQTKKSQKERATDHPSWVNNGDIKWEDTAHENAARMMDEKYGKGNWDMSTSEKAYSKILKWLRRDVGLK